MTDIAVATTDAAVELPAPSFAPLIVPALRAHMGDWVYYIGFMRLADLAERVNVAAEIHKSERLRELIQRALRGKRAEEIRDYLLTHAQRFFSTLVVGVYGGDPEWFELGLRSNDSVDVEAFPTYMEGSLGFLKLNGRERLFALDGQHRLVGTREALENKKAGNLKNEEVSVIFVSHQTTDSGLERTRRLFSTLNRYARPVSKPEIVALDEDDVVAVVTRRLVDEYPLFTGKKSSTTKTSSLPRSDRVSFVPMVTIYDALDSFLRTKDKWTDFKTRRPADDAVSEFYDRSVGLWDTLRRHFPPLEKLAASPDTAEVPGEYRGGVGGHLLFRPIGVLLVVRALKALVDEGFALNDAARRLAKVPHEFAEAPWAGLLYDPVNNRMMTWANQQKVALAVLVYGAGGSFDSVGTTEEQVRKSWAGMLNLNSPVDLPPFQRFAKPPGTKGK